MWFTSQSNWANPLKRQWPLDLKIDPFLTSKFRPKILVSGGFRGREKLWWRLFGRIMATGEMNRVFDPWPLHIFWTINQIKKLTPPQFFSWSKTPKPVLTLPSQEIRVRDLYFDPDLPENGTVNFRKIRVKVRGDQGLSNDVPHKSIEQRPTM